MMFGFSRQRRMLLEAELERFTMEMPPLGAQRGYLIGDVAKGKVQPDTELDLLLVQETTEPFHRRSDFWVTHLRPSVGTRFLVYTPQEFEELAGSDPLLVETQAYGEVLFDDG